MSPRLRWTIAFTMLMALLVERAWACSCAVLSICELVEKSDVIFLGEVIQGGLDPGEDAWSGRPKSATLRIVEAYKGLRPDVRDVTVSLQYLPGMCSAGAYRLGKRTLAFLRQAGSDGILHDGACSGSRFAEGAAEQIQYVRAYFAGQTQATILGKVAANRLADLASFVLNSPDGTPVQGAQITAEGNGTRLVATTNDRGEYALVGLPPGDYKVSAEKQDYSKTNPRDLQQQTSFAVKVSARGCATQDLGLWARNSVEGTIRDNVGNPVAGIKVFLQKVNGEPDRYGDEAKTNERGEFRFERIDPREHHLVVSPFGATPDSPYETRFYGGAASRDQAQAVNIDAGSHLVSMDIDLERRISTRSIRILLEWPDGKPVSNAFIRCGDAATEQRFHGAAEETSNGFVCKALTDRSYRIRATRIGYNNDLQDTPEMVVPSGDADTSVTIRVGPQDTSAAKR